MRIAFKTAQGIYVDDGTAPKEEWVEFRDNVKPEFFILEAESEEELKKKIHTIVDNLFDAAFNRGFFADVWLS